MPIRLNLLAELQEAEEMRRKDPVKRAFLFGGLAVGVCLVWIVMLQLQVNSSKKELDAADSRLKQIEERSKSTISNQVFSAEIEKKTRSLNRYAANRFLWGSVLNALQDTAMDRVPMISFQADQRYVPIPESVLLNKTLMIPTPPAPPGWKFWASAPPMSGVLGLASNEFKNITNKAPFLTNRLEYVVSMKDQPKAPGAGEVAVKVDFKSLPALQEIITITVSGRDYVFNSPSGPQYNTFAASFTNSPFLRERLQKVEGFGFVMNPDLPRVDLTEPPPQAQFIPFSAKCTLQERLFTNE